MMKYFNQYSQFAFLISVGSRQFIVNKSTMYNVILLQVSKKCVNIHQIHQTIIICDSIIS